VPFTYLVDEFLPALQMAGIDDQTIKQLVQHNPFAAYAR
jgi:predicted metal-dependent phosphotriesterase family hydrolase